MDWELDKVNMVTIYALFIHPLSYFSQKPLAFIGIVSYLSDRKLKEKIKLIRFGIFCECTLYIYDL